MIVSPKKSDVLMLRPILPAFLSVQGFYLSEDEKKLFAKSNPLGVCLFARGCTNVQNKEQLKKLCREIKEIIGRENVLIAVDQEGGRVRRLTEPEFTPLTEQAALRTPELVKMHADLAAYDLKTCGINVNFAPVLDLFYPFTSNVLKGRCFSDDEKQTAEFGRIMADEYAANGICPCIKHLPGHGRAETDPHLELPVVKETAEELEKDFYPFKKLGNAPMGMAAHLLLKAIDAENPASLSSTVIQQIIREKLGFNGFLVSDAIMMRALKGSITERAKRTIKAGCDAVCLGNAGFEDNRQLADSGLVLSDEGAERLNKISQIISRPLQNLNYIQLKNNYCTELKNIISYNSEYDATEVLSRINNK